MFCGYHGGTYTTAVPRISKHGLGYNPFLITSKTEIYTKERWYDLGSSFVRAEEDKYVLSDFGSAVVVGVEENDMDVPVVILDSHEENLQEATFAMNVTYEGMSQQVYTHVAKMEINYLKQNSAVPRVVKMSFKVSGRIMVEYLNLGWDRVAGIDVLKSVCFQDRSRFYSYMLLDSFLYQKVTYAVTQVVCRYLGTLAWGNWRKNGVDNIVRMEDTMY